MADFVGPRQRSQQESIAPTQPHILRRPPVLLTNNNEEEKKDVETREENKSSNTIINRAGGRNTAAYQHSRERLHSPAPSPQGIERSRRRSISARFADLLAHHPNMGGVNEGMPEEEINKLPKTFYSSKAVKREDDNESLHRCTICIQDYEAGDLLM